MFFKLSIKITKRKSFLWIRDKVRYWFIAPFLFFFNMTWIQPEKHFLIIFVFIKDIGFKVLVLFCFVMSLSLF